MNGRTKRSVPRLAPRDAPSADELIDEFGQAAARNAADGLDVRLARFDWPTFAEIRAELRKRADERGVEGKKQPAHFPRQE